MIALCWRPATTTTNWRKRSLLVSFLFVAPVITHVQSSTLRVFAVAEKKSQDNRLPALHSSKMSKTHPPELKKYMDKRMDLKLNGNRHVSGILRGFDPFMNIVVDDAVEHTKTGEHITIGMVVIRGNSIVILEPKERI